ncbi:MAG: efflux RND transporter permease subunit, partial [Oscillospiraceae bacterium]|nr:efflux RND transporter permease subunit [Oscillospiraceae bacterium]
MFSLPDFSVKRPVCILICVVTLILFGVTSVLDMPMESTPEMNMPVVMVMTTYSDASPEEVDSMVTDPVEAALASVEGIKSMTSTSSEGRSMVQLEFDYSADSEEKSDEVASALNSVRLPDSCGDPSIMEMRMNSSSVMQLNIDGATSDNALAYVEDTVVPKLEQIAGVSSVETSGGSRKYVQILLDEDALDQYGLTMNSVSNAIANAEYEISLGSVDRGNITVNMIGFAEYNTYQSLENVPISLNSGDIIHVSDVAQVNLTTQSQDSFSRQNGRNGISISISQNQSANTVTLCDKIVAAVDELNADSTLGLTIEVTSNSGETIMDNIQSVITSLIEGLAVAVLVLMFFFGNWRASLIVALSMPLSLFAAVVLMSVFDMSINLMSLGGLVVGVGMLVDNSIVVMESCFRAKNQERTFAESVHEGANLVVGAVVSSTLTSIVVVLPIALMNGMAGQLFKDVGLTIVFSLTASLISAITLIPLLFVKLQPQEKENTLANRILRKVDKGYHWLLGKALAARKTVVVIALASLALSAFLYTQIDMELMPTMDRGGVSASVELKNGLNTKASNEIMTEIEQIIVSMPDVESCSTRGGMGGGSGAGSFSITLKEDRSMETAEFVEELKNLTADIPNCHVEVSQQSAMSFGGGSGNGVTIDVKGNHLDTLKEAANEIREIVATVDGVEYASTSLSDGSPRALITVDPVLAGAYGITPSSVLSGASSKMNGITAMTLQQDDTEYSVKVEYPSGRYETVNDLYGLMIDLPGGGQIPLTDLAEISYSTSPSSISREDGKYVVSVTGSLRTGMNSATVTSQAMQALSSLDLPDGVSVEEGSDMRMMTTEFGSIGEALMIAIFLVFAVMAVQFESLAFSGVVMISIPFSLVGAFLSLYLTGTSISMTSLIGLVMLVGIVVNNAIVLVDYTNQLRRGQGMEVHEALITAGRTRLRPILMTTLTTIVGLLP